MTQRLYRTQILLEPEQHRALARIASQEGRSISDVVREMLRQQLEQRTLAEGAERQRYLEGLERIREHREAILKERGGKPIDIDVVELINQMREERDAQILRAITDSGD
jgi:predicted CopG family antitoxin